MQCNAFDRALDMNGADLFVRARDVTVAGGALWENCQRDVQGFSFREMRIC